MSSFEEFFIRKLQSLAREIETAGKIEQMNQRILLGCCVYCGQKLPANSSSYQCEPDCMSHLTDRYGDHHDTTND